MGDDKEVMSVVLLSGRFKMSVSLLSGKKIAADKRLFSKEINEIIRRGHKKNYTYFM